MSTLSDEYACTMLWTITHRTQFWVLPFLVSPRYALIVVDNDNLEDIWDFNTHPNLTIVQGGVFFHYNRKLCMSTIERLLQSITMDATYDEKDISRLTNGDQGACQ